MNKHSKIILLAALAATVIAPALFAQEDEQPVRLFQLGQSYRTPMSMVEAFAEARGQEFKVDAYLPPGVPIHAHWSKLDRSPGLVAEKDYDVLCLIPYYDFRDESPPAAAGFFGLALKKNPDVRAYLVDHWPRRAMPMEDKKAWIEEHQPMFEAMAAKANEEHPDAKHPMRVIPRAAAFMDLLRYSDQIPGFRYPSTAYNDGGHQSNTSNYMFAAMEYAWIFCESPLGLPARAEQRSRRRTGPLFDLTEQQALALQRIGYYHLTHHSTSGVDLPDDDAAPATPGKIEVDATPEAVTLSWPEVKEEGTGTHKYVIRRSDGAEFDNVLARYVDRSVQSGESYTYRVVAVDFAGNESGASEPVSVDVPVDREAPEIAEVIADSTAQTVRVVFSEPVDAEAARQESRFSVNGVNALDARLAAPHIVVLTTTEMEDGEQYTLTVRNMPDRAAAPNTADALAAAFTFKPPRWTTFDLDEWDGTEVELEGPQLRITAKGEGGFQSRLTFDKPAMAGIYREVEGDFDVPLAITSQGQVAATLELKPYQRKGNVKTGFVLAEDIENIGQGYFAVFYLDDSTRFRMTVHRKWIITGRHIGAGLSQGDPRKNRQGLDLPVWLRFVREGKLLTAYYSKTGVGEDDWTKLGSIKADRMPDKVQLGIFNMSGVADEHSTAMFDLRATGKEQSYTNVGE